MPLHNKYIKQLQVRTVQYNKTIHIHIYIADAPAQKYNKKQLQVQTVQAVPATHLFSLQGLLLQVAVTAYPSKIIIIIIMIKRIITIIILVKRIIRIKNHHLKIITIKNPHQQIIMIKRIIMILLFADLYYPHHPAFPFLAAAAAGSNKIIIIVIVIVIMSC